MACLTRIGCDPPTDLPGGEVSRRRRLAMTGWLKAWIGVAGALTAACTQTAECDRLEGLKQERIQVLHTARTRAALAERLKRKAEAAKSRAERRLETLGLERPPGTWAEALEARVHAMPGATFRVQTGPGDASGDPERSSTGVVTFSARSWRVAVEMVKRLEEAPPLFRFVRLRRSGSGRFEAEWAKLRIPRIPLDDLKSQPLPSQTPVETVPSQFGFCGAGGLREELRALDAEIDELADQAAQTTRYLPLAASWAGVAHRAGLFARAEQEAREVRNQLIEAATRARLRILGVGAQENAVVLELPHAPRDRGRLERRLPAELLKRLRYERAEARGILRVIAVDPRAIASAPGRSSRRPR